jgi:uncharacterized protein
MNERLGQFTIEITTTALCNLGCTYCFEGVKTNKQRLDDKLDLVKQRIHELRKSPWFRNKYDSLNISFWGGEPTLNGKMIIDVMNEFNEYPEIEFHIYTNGYNRKRLEDIFDAVDTSKLQIQISYDGKDINDKFRLTHTGKPTSSTVVENIEYFARKGINISLKSTIPLKSMTGLYKTWLDFRDLHQRLNSIGRNITVTYAPTIDYVNEIPSGDLPKMIEDFRKEMLMVAREEIKFYREHNHHLMSWFDGGDTKVHCASGANMHAIDVDGQSYACHGSLYSPNKELMRGSSIDQDSFVDDVAKMSETYSIPIRTVSDICKGCVATTCMICPVSSLDNSKKEDYFDRWTDRWVNNMCGFFKAFGEIDRTVQSYLDNELQVVTEKAKQLEMEGT